MNNPFDRFIYNKTLIADLFQYCSSQLPFSDDKASDTDNDFLEKLSQLSHFSSTNDEFIELGQSLISRIVANYPHITPLVNRDLFWFFGGSCLHYMSDDEIQCYQQLEELLFDAEQSADAIDFNQLKSKAFRLH